MTVRYGVLGPLEVTRDGVVLDVGSPKQRTVLACLLLASGRVVPIDRLLDVVWGDRPPPSAQASLQVYLSHLRGLLRDDAGGVSPLTRRAPGYVLEPGEDAVDLQRFAVALEAARSHVAHQEWQEAAAAASRALGCWRGPVLADLGGAQWCAPEAQALHEQLVEARGLAATALLGSGETARALTLAQGLTHDEPLRDDACRLLALALHRAGRTAEALEALRAHASRLDGELGLELSVDLRDLQVALLRQDAWTTRWPRADDAAAPSPSTAGPRRGPAAPEPADPPVAHPTAGLVGRGPQLAVAGDLVGEVVGGATGWLLLSGPAGIGKTRLAEEALALAEHAGGRAVRVRCLEEEGAPAWWPLRQLVRGLGADPDVVLQVPEGAEADTARFTVYERVRDLLEESASSGPLAVLVDDLQWADVTSLRAMAYLATAMSASRVLVVVTMRDTEGGPEVRRTTTDLLRARTSRHLVVPPLEPDDVASLVAWVAGDAPDPARTRELADRTGGNPLFVSEYARLSPEERLSGEVPLAVRGVLGRRLESLDAGTLQVLRAAAVIGDVLDLDLLGTVTRTGAEDLLDLLDDAADERIIVPRRDGAGYAFAHALLREEVLAGMSPVRRQRLHLRAAEALATQGGERLTRRAQHLLAASPLADPRELVEACRAAALQAEERWSSETAVRWWQSARTALDLLPEDEQDPQERDDLLVAQVEALARSGRGQTVLQVVEHAVLEAHREGRPTTVGRLAATLLRAAGTWPWVADAEGSAGLLARLVGLEPFVADDVAAHVRLLAALAVGHCYDPDPAVPDALSTRALALAEQAEDPEVLADALLGRVLTYVGVADHAEECEALLDRMLRLPRARGEADAVVAHSARTMSRVMLGDVAGAQEELRRGIAGCDLLRLPVVRVQLRWAEVCVVGWLHGPDAALATHAAAVEAHRLTELYEAGFGSMSLMMLRWQQGRLAEEPPYVGVEQEVWQAARAAETGDVELADSLVAQRLAAGGPLVWPTLGHLVVLAHVVADLGLDAHAERLVELLAPRSGKLASVGQGPVLGPVDLALARLHLLAGRPEEAHRLGAAAHAQCVRGGSAYWAACCVELTSPARRAATG